MLYISDAPLRFGFVFIVNDDDDVDGADDAGVAMVRAFNFALMEDDGAKAMDLITRVNQAPFPFFSSYIETRLL